MIGKLILMFWKKVGKINQNCHYVIMNVIFITMYFVTFPQTLIILLKTDWIKTADKAHILPHHFYSQSLKITEKIFFEAKKD